MLDRGYVTLARFRGAPIRLHWSIPLGALVFTGFSFAPGAWIGIVALIVLHEVGHAILVRARGLHTVSIDVHGLGGVCRYEGDPTPLSRAIIAWGGVLAQILVYAVTRAVLAFTGSPEPQILRELVWSLLGPNLWMIAINLLPVAPLDGAEAWKLPGMLWRRWRKRRSHQKIQRARKAMQARDPGDVQETVREALERARREAASEDRKKA
ncbi:MAG: hypothetical protein K8H88_08620 [Sandaracinaceae bacterium]|nr:hypothetical protein [Sandaracinaceae bacterium]